MKKILKKMWEKKESQKGFTLVELIVVLVILALLAAIMIPSMVGWIDKANEKKVVVEARTVYLAAQTVASEQYLKSPTETELTADSKTEVVKIAGITGFAEDKITTCTIDAGTVTNFACESADGKYTATFDGTNWTVAKKE